MMLDRLFLAEEQHSLEKLRHDYENQILNIPVSNSEPHTPQQIQLSQHQQIQHQPSTSRNMPSSATSSQLTSHSSEPPLEDYDEWACIQRELGCLPQNDTNSSGSRRASALQQLQLQQHSAQAQLIAANGNPKRSASSDSRLETLKRFRVDKHHKSKSSDCHIPSSSASVQNSVITSVSSTMIQSNNQQSSSKSNNNPNSYEITMQNSSYASSHDDNEPENNSIDEQVQSAIDSILNLQQNNLNDLDSILS